MVTSGDQFGGQGQEQQQIDEIYERYRRELAHEDNLINQRLGWFFVAQSLLFAGLGVALKQNICALSEIVIGVGFISSILILISVIAAVSAFFRWRYLLTQDISSSSVRNEEYPHLMRSRSIMIAGFVAPLGLPILFMIAWLLAWMFVV